MKDTHDTEFIRDFTVSVDRLWKAVTRPEELVQWFGPEGVRLESCDMDFTRTGPWVCVMIGRESGNIFKVSGQVTSVRAPDERGTGSVGFTWAWHDDADRRGDESHVSFTVTATERGSRLTLSHRDLPTLEEAQSHTRGWLATLPKLERYLGQ